MSDELYGDLIETNHRYEIEELVRQKEKQAKTIRELEQELSDMKFQLESLQAEKQTIERNFICMYNTAMTEIARKDKELIALRLQVEANRTLS